MVKIESDSENSGRLRKLWRRPFRARPVCAPLAPFGARGKRRAGANYANACTWNTEALGEPFVARHFSSIALTRSFGKEIFTNF